MSERLNMQFLGVACQFCPVIRRELGKSEQKR